MSRRIVAILGVMGALALGPGCSEGGAGGGGDTYVPLPGDFIPFRGWTRIFLGDGPLEGHPAGPRYGYVKTKPGATEYPIGAIIVKTVENGEPQQWDVFAMAKRGGNYNPGGATNWEFFTLLMNGDNVPIVVNAGTNPSDPDRDAGIGHGYSDPSGSGVTCNRCHGVAGTERSDHILSPLLAPGALQ
jgi:hypothetical protein